MALSYLTGRRNAHISPWTGERDAILVRLWTEGFSASQIAAQISDVVVSRMAVIGRVHRLKLPARKPRQPARRKPRKVRMFVPKPPPPQPPKPPPPPPGEPKMRRLKLVDLKPTSCRWPIGDGPQWLFCGADRAEGGVYCPFHQRIARVKDKRG